MTTTDSTKIQKHKYAAFFAAFSRLKAIGYPDDRHELIDTCTKGRTSSLKDCTNQEIKEMLDFMNHILEDYNSETGFKETRRRRKLIAMFCQMGYLKEDKPDMERIHSWCKSHGHLKVNLNQYSGKDLSKLIYQAEQVYKSFLNAL